MTKTETEEDLDAMRLYDSTGARRTRRSPARRRKHLVGSD